MAASSSMCTLPPPYLVEYAEERGLCFDHDYMRTHDPFSSDVLRWCELKLLHTYGDSVYDQDTGTKSAVMKPFYLEKCSGSRICRSDMPAIFMFHFRPLRIGVPLWLFERFRPRVVIVLRGWMFEDEVFLKHCLRIGNGSNSSLKLSEGPLDIAEEANFLPEVGLKGRRFKQEFWTNGEDGDLFKLAGFGVLFTVKRCCLLREPTVHIEMPDEAAVEKRRRIENGP